MVLGAREEILASAFIFGDDPFTLTGLGLLRDAARRGVRVRLIADAQWNRIPAAVQAHLKAEGIEIREYHPFRLDRPLWLVRRMHDKLTVIDGRILLAGGRNIQSTYFGFGRQIRSSNYVDCDLQVEGDAAAEARRYFLALWESREVRPTRARATPEEIQKAALLLDHHKTWLDARIEEARNDPNRPPAVLAEAGPVRFLHDPVRGDRTRKVGSELRDLLASARESAVVESPYLVPSRAFLKALREALGRGVRVRILTNSLGATDNLWPQAGYVGHKRDLVRSGVEALGVPGAGVPPRQGRGDRRRDGDRGLLQSRSPLPEPEHRARPGRPRPPARRGDADPDGRPSPESGEDRRPGIPGRRGGTLLRRLTKKNLEVAPAAAAGAGGAGSAVREGRGPPQPSRQIAPRVLDVDHPPMPAVGGL